MKKFRFSIDRGGTFTDIYCEVFNPVSGKTKVITEKLLSVDPSHYKDAPTEGIRRVIASELKKKIPTSKDIPTKHIKWIRMGTTVATNALLEREGKSVCLVTTKGFGDICEIGDQARPDIFSLRVDKPSLLYKNVIEVDERILLKRVEGQEKMGKISKGISGEPIIIEKSPDVKKLEENLKKVQKKGIESIAVVLLHSYTFHDHELLVEKIARKVGFKHVSVSHKIMPMIRAVSRGFTTLVDAYLSPILKEYIDSFCSGFENDLKGVELSFMQSDCGLTDAKTFFGSKSIFSGPAGGCVGYSQTAYEGNPLIGFDMGGTSTDVSRFDGKYEHVYDCEIAGVRIQTPQLDIVTVAAGGGSRLFFKQGRFIVGPESSSAHPGPVCYGKNGHLSITDANLILGRIIPEYFPKIFGPNEDQPLDFIATKKAFEKLTREINAHRKSQGITKEMSIEDVAFGFIEVANEAMCRPIRNITVARGFDTRNHTLCCFGGAAPQHACEVARNLGIKKIKIHKYTGILSAVGLSLSDIVEEIQEPCNLEYNIKTVEYFEKKFENFSSILSTKLKRFKNINILPYLNMRYEKTDYSIMITLSKEDIANKRYDQFRNEFEKRYEKEHGFRIPKRKVIVDDIRSRGIGKTDRSEIFKQSKELSKTLPKPISKSKMFCESEKHQTVPVYDLNELVNGNEVIGPAIILCKTSTIILLPKCKLLIDKEGNIEIFLSYENKLEKSIVQEGKIECDPIMLSIFSHRFMSIAEEIGFTLKRLAISTNIRERLDFSCAIFGPSGELVANAPNVPVHLGSMSDAVKFQLKYLGDSWKEGEVIMTNHPLAGGTHLPDITIISPVHYNGKPVFYVAARGHHADIGGITPGSMPPFSKLLKDEGAAVVSFKIVKDGKFQEDELKEILKESRCIKDNIADLKAQIAANRKGIDLFQELIKEYSLKIVHSYMKFITDNAEIAVMNMLEKFKKKLNSNVLKAHDYMDDGSKINLTVTIDKGKAIFDFKGTTLQILGNTNAPKAVTSSAVIYCLRCLVQEDIPLNSGCLKPVKIIIPNKSLLSPSKECGVVGGNVETSQRITDVIFKCFRIVSASQGTMNNFTCGNNNFGYYETICGGSGAGNGWDGTSCVQCHMTNTRITDPEIMEQRYPFILRNFKVRKGSGGNGLYKGGDGVIRTYEFLDDLEVGILSERRVFSPYGMEGGEDGKRGKNIYVKYPGNEEFSLGSKNVVKVKRFDKVIIYSPGAGGFGKAK